MLILARHPGEEILIGDDIRLVVIDIRGDRVRLGFTAPETMSIDRLEVRTAKDRKKFKRDKEDSNGS